MVNSFSDTSLSISNLVTSTIIVLLRRIFVSKRITNPSMSSSPAIGLLVGEPMLMILVMPPPVLTTLFIFTSGVNHAIEESLIPKIRVVITYAFLQVYPAIFLVSSVTLIFIFGGSAGLGILLAVSFAALARIILSMLFLPASISSSVA